MSCVDIFIDISSIAIFLTSSFLPREVAGSEDSNVYFYDLTRPKHTCVNKLQVHLIIIYYLSGIIVQKLTRMLVLQGHRFPVIGIAWNYGENLLASSDFFGTVIVWKRARTDLKK